MLDFKKNENAGHPSKKKKRYIFNKSKKMKFLLMKIIRRKIFNLIIISLLTVSHSIAQTKISSAPGIDSVFLRFSEAYRTQNALALRQLYAPAGAIIRHEAGNPPMVIQGHENITQYFSTAFETLRAQRTSITIVFKTLSLIADDTRATVIGYYKITRDEQQSQRDSYGKFAVLLQKSGGQWYFITDTESRATEDEWKKSSK